MKIDVFKLMAQKPNSYNREYQFAQVAWYYKRHCIVHDAMTSCPRKWDLMRITPANWNSGRLVFCDSDFVDAFALDFKLAKTDLPIMHKDGRTDWSSLEQFAPKDPTKIKLSHTNDYGSNWTRWAACIPIDEAQYIGKFDAITGREKTYIQITPFALYQLSADVSLIVWDFEHGRSEFTDLGKRIMQVNTVIRPLGLSRISLGYAKADRWQWDLLSKCDIIPRQCARSGY